MVTPSQPDRRFPCTGTSTRYQDPLPSTIIVAEPSPDMLTGSNQHVFQLMSRLLLHLLAVAEKRWHKRRSRCFQHLQRTLLERYQIMAFLQTGRSQTEIAETINRSKSTISREIRRNSFKGAYDFGDAQVTATARRKFAEKATKQSPEVLQTVRKWLRIGWSPESISHRFSVEFPSQKHVCHTTIYDWIDKDRQRRGKLHRYLPRYGKHHWKGGKRKRAGGLLFLTA